MSSSFTHTLRNMRGWSMPLRIVAVNVALFIILRFTAAVAVVSGHPDFIYALLTWLELPASLPALLVRPWTIFTYMWTQYDVLHLMLNMLWFYWFATMFATCRPRGAALLSLYIAGGLAGAVLYIAVNLISPTTGGALIGSSAAVMAIVTAVALLMPRVRMQLLFLGGIEVRWIAVATLIIMLAGTDAGNLGSLLAHLGGVVAGGIWAMASHRRPIHKKRSAAGTESATASLDTILDKIRKSGYSSLTPDERDRLFGR
ncbi:MAG: rhomboid family intramembrane serine protease [Duncaniella sp.]|nr:rhomboid family intramembrane serine protease [Duncaniella sp.]